MTSISAVCKTSGSQTQSAKISYARSAMNSAVQVTTHRPGRAQRPIGRRLRLSGSAVAVAMLTASSLLHAQSVSREMTDKVVHQLQEPRHRTVHQQGGLFLIDLQINPGDTTYAHTHNQAILRVRISDGDGPMMGEVTSDTSYVRKPFTHTMHNAGNELIHSVALVNDSRGVSQDTQDAPDGVTAEPILENPWFRAYRIELSPGESTALQTHYNPTAIIQGSAGKLHVTRSDGIVHELSKAGDWAWRDAGSAFSITNAGDVTVVVAIGEGRRVAR